MKSFFVTIFKIVVVVFAIIGFVFTGVFFAMKLGLTKDKGLVDSQNEFWKRFQYKTQVEQGAAPKAPLGSWVQSEEWYTLRDAIMKDKLKILNAASDVEIDPRLIVAQIVSEQLRMFTSQRDTFKQIFQPLRILGTQSQFSMGVTGVKEETAQKIEEYLKDKTSEFYINSKFEHLLDYPTEPTGAMRIARLADERNHYYSYLYTAVYLKQIISQWKRAGHPIAHRPEILATLFNLGFSKSSPKADPKVGGAPITIGNETYSFGGLAGQFFYSDELLADFPRIGN